MQTPPVLSLPDGIGRYTLYSDTSKTHAGSALWQKQQGQNKLIGYASKSLPKACVNYGITELEMMGLLVNMKNWEFYLGKKDFDAAVDHRAIPNIMKLKELPATDRIIRLLQGLSRLNFHLYYVKGKDMILCDFLSRINVDDTDPHDLIPIAFNVLEILARNDQFEEYCIMTRGQTAAAGIEVPKVHGADKPVDTNVKPERDRKLQQQIAVGIAQARPQVIAQN